MADQQQPEDVAPAPAARPCEIDDPSHDHDGTWWSAAGELEAMVARADGHAASDAGSTFSP